MKTFKKAVYFFCTNSSKDPVANSVYEAAKKLYPYHETGIVFDEKQALIHIDKIGNEYYFVQTNDVLSHDYIKYIPPLNDCFSDFDFAGVINWHEGKNAPDRILSLHTTGDVISGVFGKANPIYSRNLMVGMEEGRKSLDLSNFSTVLEATHWSGILYGANPDLITRFDVPLMDIEIGSTIESWSDQKAAEVLARSLTSVFQNENPVFSILCVGGVHIELPFTAAVFNQGPSIAVTHILPNHWLVNGAYDNEDGLLKLETCINTISGGIKAIIYHDNLKSVYKGLCRQLADKLGIPSFKHQALRQQELFTSM